jgi:endoglucanase
MVALSSMMALASLSLVSGAKAAPRPARPVEANGHLQVIGNKLSNEAGKPVQLRGVALHGIQWMGWFYEDPANLRAAALDWGIDILRITVYVYEDGYLDNPELAPADFDAMIEGYVETCVDVGIYCILDWHVHHPGNPLYYTEAAKAFFEKYSKKYGDLPNVLYEIANEPNPTGYDRTVDGETMTVVEPRPTPWTDIKSYADQVVPIIRTNDPDGVVLVGTPSWSQLGFSENYSWQEIRDNPVLGGNIAYVAHFYADGHGLDLLDYYKTAAAALPLFATEWSPAHYDGDEPFRSDSAPPWVQWMREAGVGGTYWAWAAGDFLWPTFDETTESKGPLAPDGANVTVGGRYLYDWLNNPPDAWANELFDPDAPPVNSGGGGSGGMGSSGMGSSGMGGAGGLETAGNSPTGGGPTAMDPTSTGGTGGGNQTPGTAGTASAVTPSPIASDGGCACRAPASHRSSSISLLALLGALALGRRRRCR